MPNNKDNKGLDFHHQLRAEKLMANDASQPLQEQTEDPFEKSSPSSFFGFDTHPILMGAILTALAILAGGFFLWPHLSHNEEKQELEQSPTTTIEKIRKSIEEDDEIKADLAKVKLITQQYLAATTVEEKVRFCRQPGRVLPLMKKWYKEHDLTSSKVSSETMAAARKRGPC